jgi:hypothetical protein
MRCVLKSREREAPGDASPGRPAIVAKVSESAPTAKAAARLRLIKQRFMSRHRQSWSPPPGGPL